jgi:hypothetical protein
MKRKGTAESHEKVTFWWAWGEQCHLGGLSEAVKFSALFLSLGAVYEGICFITTL